MKIAIITIHHIYNYGSVLQSYALCEYLRKHGYDAMIIDYRPKYRKSILRMIRTSIAKLVFLPQYILRTYRYRSFIREKIKLTKKRYTSFEQLQETLPCADIYIAGSDQLWNSYFPCGNDSAYTLGFVENGLKISYATSLGRNDISKEDLRKLVDRIKDFKFISVREETGKQQLETAGAKRVKHVCDPVFLLDKKDYQNIANVPRYKDYLLLYSVHRDPKIFAVANKIAKQKKLKTVLIGDLAILGRCSAMFKTAGPADFIGLVERANYIVTNSFHCTAFALIFEKDFTSVMPHVNATRVENILQQTGLNRRIIIGQHAKVCCEPIDYQEVNIRLKPYIEYSRNMLLTQINKIKVEYIKG